MKFRVCVCVCVLSGAGAGGVKRCGNKLYNIQLTRTVKPKGEKNLLLPHFLNHLSSSYGTQKQNFGILTKIAFFTPLLCGSPRANH